MAVHVFILAGKTIENPSHDAQFMTRNRSVGDGRTLGPFKCTAFPYLDKNQFVRISLARGK